MRTFIGEYFSPWSEKARWALDHHRLAYDYREHVPLVGELVLRIRTRQPTGRVSTPALITDEGVLTDSFSIARYADQVGDATALFPQEHEKAIIAWNARSESTLEAGRALYLERLTRDRDAKVEIQPDFLPEPIRRVATPAADLAVAFVRRKYGIDASVVAAAEATLRRTFEELRESLQERRHLIGGGLTYADIAMAVTLQFISPVDPRYIVLRPAEQRPWRHPALAERFADLVAWRDALYASCRPKLRTAG